MFQKIKKAILRSSIKTCELYGNALCKLAERVGAYDQDAAFTLSTVGISLINPTFQQYLYDHNMRVSWVPLTPTQIIQNLGGMAALLQEGYILGNMADKFCAEKRGQKYYNDYILDYILFSKPWFQKLYSWAKPLNYPFVKYWNSAEGLFALSVLSEQYPETHFITTADGNLDVDEIKRELFKQFVTGQVKN